ncbi:MAG: hypothetical protein MUO63_01040 [Desulfobulbaceae bacterium]|nr:hypothetical protein [Desulfobulbaceae bacterium]
MKMIKNSLMRFACLAAILAFLAVPAPLFAAAKPIVEDPVDTIDGPLLDKMSDSGALYGDLYRVARYKGDETKNVPVFDENGDPVYIWVDGWVDPDGITSAVPVKQQEWTTAPAVGGEPILTEEFAVYTIIDEETQDYVINPATGNIYYLAPLPSQCVQPVADHGRWGDIFAKSELDDNRIPLVMTYDPTWKRTECAVSPELFLNGGIDVDSVLGPDGETWNEITYYKDIYWADLVQEVDFGRLNLARAPKAVLDASFDEAIRMLNAAKDIKIDASGRLMVTTEIYDEFLTDGNGDALWLETVVKAIDAPKENLALYLKLMEDGHLITPAAERAPIDQSYIGGIPLTQLLELEDGPSDAPRPTIDIEKMRLFGLGYLVDAGTIEIYYIRMEADGSLYLDDAGNMVISTVPCPDGEICVEYTGVVTPSANDMCAGDDFPLAASFFAAAADKKGNITIDKIVYINSILGINKVVGTGTAYEDGVEIVINYAKNPAYYNYNYNNAVTGYDRIETFGKKRGRVKKDHIHIDYEPYEYDGMVDFLEETSPESGDWEEKEDSINLRVFNNSNVNTSLASDIAGFTSMADDNLQVIKYTHTYQIPGLR